MYFEWLLCKSPELWKKKMSPSVELICQCDSFSFIYTNFSYSVWPINSVVLCTELILTCNYLIALSSRQRRNGLICSDVDMTQAEDLVLHTLHRGQKKLIDWIFIPLKERLNGLFLYRKSLRSICLVESNVMVKE